MLATMKKWAIISLGTVAALVALGIGSLFWISNDNPYWLRNRLRRDWKDRAVTEIAHRSADSVWVAKEIATMKVKSDNARIASDPWLSPHLILMTNGEWMVYANICRKENFRIYDLFIGRASDGKWYYSTYHFCIHMINLSFRADTKGQPGSVAEFAQEYYLRDFDGHSDDCLQKTWPPKHK
jgi:hypothetical protein